MRIEITAEMRFHAAAEAKKRNTHINHHFEVGHLTGNERDIIGFLGEFACCSLLGLDWKKNIRTDYLTIDNFDINYQGRLIDVKTETIPQPYFSNLVQKKVGDDAAYGRRLIHKGQVDLLDKYNIVIFGAFARGNYNLWFPIGFLETTYILKTYKSTLNKPYGGFYPFPALPVKNSDLKNINLLL